MARRAQVSPPDGFRLLIDGAAVPGLEQFFYPMWGRKKFLQVAD